MLAVLVLWLSGSAREPTLIDWLHEQDHVRTMAQPGFQSERRKIVVMTEEG